MRLADALAALDEQAFEALRRRRSITIDPAKRLSPAEQASRALATPPELRDVAGWSDELRAALMLLAAAPDGLPRAALGGAALRLVDSGIAFVAPGEGRVTIPSAYRVQLPPSPAEPPRAIRALLPKVDD